jgi:23S rRNA (cytosine1962-C5)-methyltransferase
VRFLEWDEGITINDEWWIAKIGESVARRDLLVDDINTDSYRLVFGESDLLPGLIVDKYADYLVIQTLTAGIENVKPLIVSCLARLFHPSGIYERSDVSTREREGLKVAVGPLYGADPPDSLPILENGCQFIVDIKKGQKTGFYLDQRNNRQIAAMFAKNHDILDCFCHTGAFSVYALAKNAKSATLVDSSAQSLALAKENMRLNSFSSKAVEFTEGDVFKILREYRDSERHFDMVILDPPKFAPAKKDLKKALAAYKDINMLAIGILNPGGFLVTFSCSGAVDLQTLQTVLFWAATDAKRDVQICRTLSQGLDHPRLVTFPESEYLKGFICKVL